MEASAGRKVVWNARRSIEDEKGKAAGE